MQLDSTERFSNRVENYIKYRPGYPEEILSCLSLECGLSSRSIIADIGSGTGILAELFLKHGLTVLGVEPNAEMRTAAEKLLAKHPSFRSINGKAEATTLERHSVDFVTAGQAFHWFDIRKSREEFLNILKPTGWVVLLWNDRQTVSTPFLKAYERLLINYSMDYQTVDHRNTDENVLAIFFDHENFKLKQLKNIQVLDLRGLRGRLLSSSYIPEKGHPNYEPMLAELDSIFTQHEVQGRVTIEYHTKMYYGRL